MEQTTQGLYRLWQMLAGLWIIFVKDGFTALPGQGLLDAPVTQVFCQVVSTGPFPLWRVFTIPFTTSVVKKAGFDQQRYHVVRKCQRLGVVLKFTQLQYG